MIATDWFHILKQRFVWACMIDYWILYIRVVHHVCWTPFLISGSVSGIQDLFMHLQLAVLRRYLTGDYRQMFTQDFCYMCDRGLSAPQEWHHSNLYRYIVICTLVTVFNWWNSFHIIYYMIYNMYYIYIYIYIYIYK